VDDQAPEAIRRALPLLTDSTEPLDTSHGYLDLLDAPDPPSGAIQRLWESGIGSVVYDRVQSAARRWGRAWRVPMSTLRLRDGDVALDVACGPGEVTAGLGRAVGATGLALGVDVSVPMLTRAVRTHAGPNVGFLRADALRLPLRDDTVNAITCVAMLQLVPDPAGVLGQLARVLAPGGRLAIMVPTVLGPAADNGNRYLKPVSGLRFFTEQDIGDILGQHGITETTMKQAGPVQWTVARKGS
jgi:SAM-dependent methyltransferase